MGVIKDYELGDMLLRYSLDERGIAGLQLLPLEMSRQKLPEKEMEQALNISWDVFMLRQRIG